MKALLRVIVSGMFLAGTACIHSTVADKSQQPRAMQETLCWILADPAAYHRKTVEVRAGIRSDGIDHVQLVDEECSNVALPVELQESSGRDTEVTTLLTRAYRRGIEGSRVPIMATFTGIVEHRPGDVPSVLIHLTRVADVEPENVP